jgi:uncharacterized protein
MMRILSFFVVLSVAAAELPAQQPPRPPSVAAVGSVEVLVQPDRATLIVTLAAEAADVAAATLAVDSAVARLAAAAQAHDLSVLPWGGSYGENVAVRRMMGSPQMDARTSRDFLARSGIVISVPDAARTNTVVRDVVVAGVTASISVAYHIDEANVGIRDAYADAVSIARQRAAAMAEALGGRIGELIAVSTPMGFMPPPLQRFQTHDGMTPPLQPSDVVYRVSVNGTWAFEER